MSPEELTLNIQTVSHPLTSDIMSALQETSEFAELHEN
jgi:hypothetical protein